MAYINKNVSTMAMPSGMNRMGQFPLDMSSVYYDMESLEAYATSGNIAYVGQIVSLVDEANKKVTVYSIQNTDGTLEEIGTGQGTDLSNYFITPQMFGAVGDGSHDDTDAIQQALDADQPIVYFPPGRYRTTERLLCEKPKTIKMCRRYPTDYQKDYPIANTDDYMGARIETYSPDIGITIGGGVCLDGFYIRAMPGFGGGFITEADISNEDKNTFIQEIGSDGDTKTNVFNYRTAIDIEDEEDPEPYKKYGYLREKLDGLDGTAGKGIVLQYDDKYGKTTYPSTVRFSHIQVDMEPLLQNNTSSVIGTNVYIIPECLFEFKITSGSYHYIFEDIILGLQHNRYCDDAFRVIINELTYEYEEVDEGKGNYIKVNGEYQKVDEGTGNYKQIKIDPWCNNVYIKNMCIDCRCNYGININNKSQWNADGWVFENLTIQAYEYVDKNYEPPLGAPALPWARWNNPLNRTSHKALIKLNKMKDLTFFGCYLHDVVQYSVEWGYSEGVFKIEEQEIHVLPNAGNYSLKYDPSKNEGFTQKITCLGCSSEFEHIETCLAEKLEENRKNIDITNLSVNIEGQNLILQDKNNTVKTATLPTITINEDIINKAVSAWMDEATTPIKTIGKNKINEKNNKNYEEANVFEDCNVNRQVVVNKARDDLLFYKNGAMWTTHYIKAKPGQTIRTYTKTSSGVTSQRAAYYVLHFKNSMQPNFSDKDPYLPKTFADFIAEKAAYDNLSYTIQGDDVADTAYIRIVYMPYVNNGIAVEPDAEGAVRYQALFPQGSTESLLITINNQNSNYEPYSETYTTKLAGLLPTVTTADNGKILQVVDGKWTAISPTE